MIVDITTDWCDGDGVCRNEGALRREVDVQGVPVREAPRSRLRHMQEEPKAQAAARLADPSLSLRNLR